MRCSEDSVELAHLNATHVSVQALKAKVSLQNSSRNILFPPSKWPKWSDIAPNGCKHSGVWQVRKVHDRISEVWLLEKCCSASILETVVLL